MLWKCYNCANEKGVSGRDFEADVPTCPQCTLEMKHSRGLIVAREIVHLDPPHPVIVNAAGTGIRPCDGKPAGIGMATGHPVAVNCPKCKASPEFAKAVDKHGLSPTVLAEKDYVIEVKPEAKPCTSC